VATSPGLSHADESAGTGFLVRAAQPRERRRQVLDGAPVADRDRGGTASGGSRQIRLFVRVDRWVGSAASENVSDIYVAGQDR